MVEHYDLNMPRETCNVGNENLKAAYQFSISQRPAHRQIFLLDGDCKTAPRQCGNSYLLNMKFIENQTITKGVENLLDLTGFNLNLKEFHVIHTNKTVMVLRINTQNSTNANFATTSFRLTARPSSTCSGI